MGNEMAKGTNNDAPCGAATDIVKNTCGRVRHSHHRHNHHHGGHGTHSSQQQTPPTTNVKNNTAHNESVHMTEAADDSDDKMDTSSNDSDNVPSAVKENTTNTTATTTTNRRKVVTIGESAESFDRLERQKEEQQQNKNKSRKRNSNHNTPLASNNIVIKDALKDVRATYHINADEIGHGHYSVVRKCMNRQTKQWFAIKSILKSKVSKVEILKREIQILLDVNHPNIIKMYEVYEDAKYLHLVTELCKGGELFDRIIAKTQSKEGHFSEHDAAKLVLCILDAISYCHDIKNIVHRDLKPENFLFLTKDDNSPIKIIDFGLSRYNNSTEINHGLMKTRVGTPYYVAPEVLNREYTKSCDIWSIGVITYILLCGYPPFYGDTDNQIFDSIRQGYFDFPSPEWDDISNDAKDFICLLLKRNPSERLTAKEAMNHKWIQNQLDGNDIIEIERIRISHNSVKSFQFYKKYYKNLDKLKKAALSVIATHLTKTEIGSLKQIFNDIDKDGTGYLTIKELDTALTEGNYSPELYNDLKHLRHDLLLEQHDSNDLDDMGINHKYHQINWKEFLVATMDKHLAIREDKIKLAFDYFKNNSSTEDNVLHVSDLQNILGGPTQTRELMGYIHHTNEDDDEEDQTENGMKKKPSKPKASSSNTRNTSVTITFDEFRTAIAQSIVIDEDNVILEDNNNNETKTKKQAPTPTAVSKSSDDDDDDSEIVI